jgi:hypothetical protein
VLVAAAFCPSPPLLVPELAAGAAAELDPLREACAAALAEVLAAGVSRVVVLGAGPERRVYECGSGDLRGYGVPVRVNLNRPGDPLPLPLALGAWLLDGAVPAVGVVADPCGRVDVETEGTDGLLVMGDGSARRVAASPGALDPRGVPFDDAVAAALGSGEPARLSALDASLGAEVMAAGTPAWRAAGALLDGARYGATLRYAQAPYGVGYFVASWVRA